MEAYLYFLISLSFLFFGFVIGSFLNVVILRLHYQEVLTGRSYCPDCKKTLRALDLIPVFSFFLLGGVCRYCKAKISWQYPLVELLTGAAFALNYLVLASGSISLLGFLNVLFLCFFTSILIVVSVSDLKWGLIPDKAIIAGLVGSLLFLSLKFGVFLISGGLLLEPIINLGIDLASAIGIFLFFVSLIIITSGKGMGGGDVKLATFIGFIIGWPLNILAIFLGFLTGALVSVMLLLIGKKGLKQTIPFGPFLALGGYITALFGGQILDLYLKTLGL